MTNSDHNGRQIDALQGDPVATAGRLARRPRRHARLRALVAALAVSLCALTASARADAAVYRTAIGGVSCGSNYVSVHFNAFYTDGPLAIVQEYPELWRWNGRAWTPFRQARHWYGAAVNASGVVQVNYVVWFDQVTGQPAHGMTGTQLDFTSLSPGLYMARSIWRQRGGATRADWAGRCRIG
jgi:hypothetical protein